ncbi:MAG: tryptophan synthase subunit alpha, partial [Leptospira sp.]|nr:tryptophan synthase subunit alpha [Leptospira sp.]
MVSISESYSGSKKPKFIPYFSLGDPDYTLSVEWGKALIEGGADFLEMGIPFSDPIADGPVIQKSYKRALDNNPFSMEIILETTASIHKSNKNIPLLYLTYLNPVYAFGLKKFLKASAASGIRGLVIPDLPFDAKEAVQLFDLAK